MSENEIFQNEVKSNIDHIRSDVRMQEISDDWIEESMRLKYAYNFNWMGRPIIQFPQDIVAMQEIIWETKPDLIIETGIARGGSLIFYASLLELLNISVEKKERQVVGVDIEIRNHNRVEIEKHPMSKIITMIEGSSIDDDIVKELDEIVKNYDRVLVVLDSNHTGDHVLAECQKYSKFVTQGSYLVVMDTVTQMLFDRIEKSGQEVPEHLRRPWNRDNNVMTGLKKFMKENDCFEYDTRYDKLLISCNTGGYLKRIK